MMNQLSRYLIVHLRKFCVHCATVQIMEHVRSTVPVDYSSKLLLLSFYATVGLCVLASHFDTINNFTMRFS